MIPPYKFDGSFIVRVITLPDEGSIASEPGIHRLPFQSDISLR
jgi:hypothetical protein